MKTEKKLDILLKKITKNNSYKNTKYGLSQITSKEFCPLSIIKEDELASEGETILKEKILKDVFC